MIHTLLFPLSLSPSFIPPSFPPSIPILSLILFSSLSSRLPLHLSSSLFLTLYQFLPLVSSVFSFAWGDGSLRKDHRLSLSVMSDHGERRDRSQTYGKMLNSRLTRLIDYERRRHTSFDSLSLHPLAEENQV